MKFLSNLKSILGTEPYRPGRRSECLGIALYIDKFDCFVYLFALFNRFNASSIGSVATYQPHPGA